MVSTHKVTSRHGTSPYHGRPPGKPDTKFSRHATTPAIRAYRVAPAPLESPDGGKRWGIPMSRPVCRYAMRNAIFLATTGKSSNAATGVADSERPLALVIRDSRRGVKV